MGNGKRVVVRNNVSDCLNALISAGNIITAPEEGLTDLNDLIDAVVFYFV